MSDTLRGLPFILALAVGTYIFLKLEWWLLDHIGFKPILWFAGGLLVLSLSRMRGKYMREKRAQGKELGVES